MDSIELMKVFALKFVVCTTCSRAIVARIPKESKHETKPTGQSNTFHLIVCSMCVQRPARGELLTAVHDYGGELARLHIDQPVHARERAHKLVHEQGPRREQDQAHGVVQHRDYALVYHHRRVQAWVHQNTAGTDLQLHVELGGDDRHPELHHHRVENASSANTGCTCIPARPGRSDHIPIMNDEDYLNPMLNACLTIYPFMDGLMSYLSASDVSAFLHATRLFRVFTPEMSDRYMNMSRDMPRHAGWIEETMSRGDKVILAGYGLKVLMDRYTNPMTHWVGPMAVGECSILLIVISKNGYMMANMPRSYVVSNNTTPSVDMLTKTGDIERIVGTEYDDYVNHCGGSCFGDVCKSRIPSYPALIPAPAEWPECGLDWIVNDVTDWRPMNNAGSPWLNIWTTTKLEMGNRTPEVTSTWPMGNFLDSSDIDNTFYEVLPYMYAGDNKILDAMIPDFDDYYALFDGGKKMEGGRSVSSFPNVKVVISDMMMSSDVSEFVIPIDLGEAWDHPHGDHVERLHVPPR
ncbi:hypothetical protein FALBO_13038 [Fusarium albosuccineum]|uniref:Uncharacterized protein n=1 Tax=Fusarium albosuccineum TaxID=1237068 RepID=A0A8H4L213_9HYPO|nr:hypothetical protein FALBO_13038 [Fusarium albosuccineum]